MVSQIGNYKISNQAEPFSWWSRDGAWPEDLKRSYVLEIGRILRGGPAVIIGR
jgi:hypothetical protein